jgi:hypothetical protein
MKSTAMLGWLLLWVSATWADSIPQIVARVKPAVVTSLQPYDTVVT